MFVKIFKPAKTTMQSGGGKIDGWVLEFDSNQKKTIDPLMRWTGSSDTLQQVRLRFNTKEDAIAYANKNGFYFHVHENKKRKPIVRKNGYGENFATRRRSAWTH